MPGEIEFLPSSDAGDEPEPVQPRRHRTPRAAWVALVVVAIIALGTWAVTRPDPPERTAPAAVQPSPSPSSTRTLTEPARPAEQPTTVTCMSGGYVNPAVAALMRIHLRGIAVTQRAELVCTRGVRDDQHIVFERAIGTYRGLLIVVDIGSRGTAPNTPFPASGHGIILMSVDTESAGLHAHIVVLGPGSRHAPVTGVQRLADDLSLNLVL